MEERFLATTPFADASDWKPGTVDEFAAMHDELVAAEDEERRTYDALIAFLRA